MSKNWKGHQKAVARAFRMVETSVRVAPPDCPDSVDVDIVRKRLELERFDHGMPSSRFLPEAKSGYHPSQVWLDIQIKLKELDATQNELFPIVQISNQGDPLWIMLMEDMQLLLHNVEVGNIQTRAIVINYKAMIPQVPVGSGFGQLYRYIQKPQYANKKPVVVWHFDRFRFGSDLCFFREADLREVGGKLLKIFIF